MFEENVNKLLSPIFYLVFTYNVLIKFNYIGFKDKFIFVFDNRNFHKKENGWKNNFFLTLYVIYMT